MLFLLRPDPEVAPITSTHIGQIKSQGHIPCKGWEFKSLL